MSINPDLYLTEDETNINCIDINMLGRAFGIHKIYRNPKNIYTLINQHLRKHDPLKKSYQIFRTELNQLNFIKSSDIEENDGMIFLNVTNWKNETDSVYSDRHTKRIMSDNWIEWKDLQSSSFSESFYNYSKAYSDSIYNSKDSDSETDFLWSSECEDEPDSNDEIESD